VVEGVRNSISGIAAIVAGAIVVTVAEVWVVAIAFLFGTAVRRAFLTGDTSVVSGAYFLVGPLLLGDLFGDTPSSIVVKMPLK
jgi:hypothetical protein